MCVDIAAGPVRWPTRQLDVITAFTGEIVTIQRIRAPGVAIEEQEWQTSFKFII